MYDNARKLADAAVRAIRRRYKSGATCAELAKEYHVTPMAIAAAASGRSYAHVPGAAKMRRKGPYKAAKLTDANIRSIRALKTDGVKVQEIADRFGVSVSTIYAIASGVAWGHIV